MGNSDDFFFTGGGFSDWSGGSSGKSSSGGGHSNGPWPNGCACMVIALLAGLLALYWESARDGRHDQNNNAIELSDSTTYSENDIAERDFDRLLDSMLPPEAAPARPVPKPAKPSSRRHRSSRSYTYDDEYDEDEMYKDEDEDIKDKRQYDDYDDDEADDWE